jgi:hypothetical protein
LLKSRHATQEDTQLVKPEARLGTVEVTADGEGLVSHAGAALLVELADRVGLTGALSGALAGTRERRSAHDPGRVLRDVAVMLADGGACVTDMDGYRGQERLFGARASETTTHRVLQSIDEQLLGRIRAGRAVARARVWDAGARPDTITLNIDATLLTAHSEKELAAGNYKHGYGFHPLNCYLDETGEALAAILRPGMLARTPPLTTSPCSGSRSNSCQPRTFTARSWCALISAARRTRSPPIAARLGSASPSVMS